MTTLPTARSDIPMIPVPVFPHNANFIQHGGDNSHLNKVPVQAGRVMHPGHMGVAANTTATESLQLLTTEGLNNKTSGEQNNGSDAIASNEAVDPNQLKYWSVEETVELIQLYKKYLPEFHKFGQRKMNVWQKVTEEMVAKGYHSYSWAECSAKFRSLRDSYRRTATGGRAHAWQFFTLMKDVMKTEKMILEQEPATRPHKPSIPCNDARNTALSFSNPALVNSGLPTAITPHTTITTNTAISQQLSLPHSDNAEAAGTETDLDDLTRKRNSSDLHNGPATKKLKESDQETEIVIGQNLNGEPVKAKNKQSLGVLGSLQALGKSLSLPQSQLVVCDDGQIVQTTSAPTGLFIGDNGQLVNNQSTPSKQTVTMPQWFKLYEKRTRAENSRRLEELKEMHRESLELQRQTLEVARHKNELLKNLMDSLAQFKDLLHT